MFRLVCLVCCITFTIGQGGEHCCAPDQWEGYFNAITGFVHGSDAPDVALEFHRLHVDHKGNRTAATLRVYYENSGRSRLITVIDNFKTKRRLYLEDNTCTIVPLEQAMRSPCLPTQAIHLGHFYIGTGNGTGHLDIEAWELPMEPPSQFHIRVATDGCIPYQFRLVTIDHEQADASFVSFNRITAGIEDDKVFDTPTECQPRKHLVLPEPIKDVLSLFHQK